MTTERKDGGQAFPKSFPGDAGMTLRDWFAGQALVGILAASKSGELHSKDAAWHAYGFADAMIERRLKP